MEEGDEGRRQGQGRPAQLTRFGVLACRESIRRNAETGRLRLATWGELWECLLLHARSGRNGIGLAREVLLKRHGKRVPDMEFARLFLRLLDAAGLPEPVCEHDVTAGGNDYRLDCAYQERGIAIELDGKGHLEEVVYAGG